MLLMVDHMLSTLAWYIQRLWTLHTRGINLAGEKRGDGSEGREAVIAVLVCGSSTEGLDSSSKDCNAITTDFGRPRGNLAATTFCQTQHAFNQSCQV